MTANPPLVQGRDGILCPQPYQNEAIVLRRESIELGLDNLHTSSGKWATRGVLYLTNLRLVFVAAKEDGSGLRAFDLPLAYTRREKFNQPIFSCNNLSGECWPTAEGGGPGGTLPPHKFVLSFKEGGVGTFLPLFFRFLETVRQAEQQHQQQHQPFADSVQASVATAFIDPSDPSTVFLTQPVGEEQRRADMPRYAANYGQEEKYEDMSGPGV